MSQSKDTKTEQITELDEAEMKGIVGGSGQWRPSDNDFANDDLSEPVDPNPAAEYGKG